MRARVTNAQTETNRDEYHCYAPGGISCVQHKKCKIENGQQSWESLSGDDGSWCNLRLVMTIIKADMTANDDPNLKRGVLNEVSGLCNDKETCAFTIKDYRGQPTGSFGDPMPSHHVTLSVTYVCRSPTQSKGKTRIVFPQDWKPVQWSCLGD
jgi:hypothetical protein